uniref:Uncharacterized protein n=1 Tax=Anguilla anguilla TaxID=7936 RepID=A0A0E9X3X6_ANGAN
MLLAAVYSGCLWVLSEDFGSHLQYVTLMGTSVRIRNYGDSLSKVWL